MGLEKKEMVILSKSKKYGRYCVAGIDCSNNSLIRVISDNKNVSYAMSLYDISDYNGVEANVMDKVVVPIKRNTVKIKHQPENVMMDTEKYIENNGAFIKSSLKLIVNQLCNKYSNIFYNYKNNITKEEFKSISSNEIHSLEIIKSELITLRVKDVLNKSLKCNIRYNNEWYNDFSVTDIEFNRKMFDYVFDSERGYITLRDVYLLVSLGEEFNGNFYKLVATIIEF